MSDKLYDTVEELGQLQNLLKKEKALVVYFSHEQCNVCKVLKPKVAQMLKKHFPKVKMVYADTMKSPEIAGQNRIFAVPTIVGFIEGKEYFRKSRSIGINELAQIIERPYQMLFEEN